ncbi:MAG: helix-turn-helix transcriptional regulator [Alphaproteobacteria bacterium]|nr:helix-turn-helix transcriptional regulator [Alphaproteobacteria bacterium]MBL7097335.1 helix-turn-helix transcriptional regulator [Alphaproteobacteria bacterium]
MNTCRLRKFRKSTHLTQREVAMLVGYTSQRAYSDLELGLKRPALGTALACSILFDVAVRELFPDLADHVERDVLARARKLKEKIANDTNREATAAYIASAVDRIGGSGAVV